MINETNLISSSDSMPGDEIECLFLVQCFIDFKDKYKCGEYCHPMVRFYAVDQIIYCESIEREGKVGRIEDGIWICFNFDGCENPKQNPKQNHIDHKLKYSDSDRLILFNMKQVTTISSGEVTHWGIDNVYGWLPITKKNDKEIINKYEDLEKQYR